ncbi:hypothetical protein LINGRAHAP2_LOCUS16329 [Linum grandiflorum]
MVFGHSEAESSIKFCSGYCNPFQQLFVGPPTHDPCHGGSLQTSIRGHSQPYLPRNELYCGLIRHSSLDPSLFKQVYFDT